MKAELQSLRAASGTYALSMLQLIFRIGLGVFVLLSIIVGLLVHYVSAWWFALGFVFFALFVFFCLALFFARLIARKIVPANMTQEQKKHVRTFNQKVSSIIEQTQTSYFILIVQLIKDVVVHREARTIKNLIGESASLKQDFKILKQFFE